MICIILCLCMLLHVHVHAEAETELALLHAALLDLSTKSPEPEEESEGDEGDSDSEEEEEGPKTLSWFARYKIVLQQINKKNFAVASEELKKLKEENKLIEDKQQRDNNDAYVLHAEMQLKKAQAPVPVPAKRAVIVRTAQPKQPECLIQ